MEPFPCIYDTHSKIVFDGCPVDGVQTISILQSKCENMTFSDQSRYNTILQQVVPKVGQLHYAFVRCN